MDNALEKRLNELALRSKHTGRVCVTRFLEPSSAGAVNAAAAGAGVKAAFWGGYEGAERCLAAFYADEPPGPGDWPILALRIQWNSRFASPGHRDLLGAVMGLGIERETTGDIAMGSYRDAPCAYLFALREVADYIAANLESAGRASLKVSPAGETPVLLPPEGESLRLTVQQQRLDAVLAAACRLSRAEAQRLIAAGLVKLNHAPQTRADARIGEGDLISARGYGRVRVTAFQGESRRGRQIVQVFRYGEPRKN
jgi:RNA-binding protein YlmH